MEKSRNAVQKIQKMEDLGIYNRFLKNSEDRIRELYRTYSLPEEYLMTLALKKISRRLIVYNFLSDAIESSFLFSDTPEKQDFWNNIVDELRSEI